MISADVCEYVENEDRALESVEGEPSSLSTSFDEKTTDTEGATGTASSTSLIAENEVTVTEAPLWSSGIDCALSDFGKPLYKRLFHPGPIAAIFIIFTVGFTTTIFHASWWPITTAGGCLDLLLFLTWNYQVLSNLLRAAFIGGGYIPLGWRPPAAEDEPRLQYCPRCNGYKAPRSHHCTKCNRCVMKMDHHCPWINNCVGHRNQVFFIRFLFFAIVGCAHATFILASCLWNTVKEVYFFDYGSHYQEQPDFLITSIYAFFAAVMALSFAIGVFTAISFLLFIQLKIAYKNITGVEEYICLKAVYRRGDDGEFVYPYDLGWRRNLREVFNGGASVPKGNGVWWPIRASCTQFTFSEEQLVQKAIKRRRLLECGPDVEEPGRCKRLYHRLVKFVLWQKNE